MIDFNKFWKAYPKKVARVPAQRAWDRLSVGKQAIAIKDIADGRYTRTEKAYIPNGATYINQERWEDEIIEQPRQKEEWEIIPFEDENLAMFAQKHGLANARPGESYYEFRHRLQRSIDERMKNDE